jgi:16S rRNA (adenine1518-N6/adenine1519-N6)-dimethyltransferase
MTLYQQVREYLKRTNRRPSKKLGQHFLVAPHTLQEIVWAAEVKPTDLVLEIGAGLGFLTALLVESAEKVIAVEVDEVLYAELQLRFAKAPRIALVQGDILKLDIAALLDGAQRERTKVVANLPYYITTPILWKLLELRGRISACVLTMQTEVAQRLASPPGGKDYGALSISVSYHAQAEIVRQIPPDEFYPSPQVQSAVVRLRMRDNPPVVLANEALFFRIVRAAFQSRRKMLRNALLSSSVPIPGDALDAVFNQTGIDPRRRGETLTIAEFAALANSLHHWNAE